MVGHQYHYHWIERADLLKANARFLQFQLRQRFRVAVDRHVYRCRSSLSGSTADRHLSSVFKRWLNRFPDLRGDSLSSSSSSAFSRKRVLKDIYGEEDSAITRMLQAVAVPVLGNVCHIFMHGFNRVQVYGAEKLHKVLHHRPKDRPLITVSNHVASMDDPLVIASLLPPRVLMDAQNLRWTLCATDRCFKNPVTSAFFRSVKVLPVSRGDGIYQKGLDMAISKLNSGGWVHIFPEGSRSRDGGKTLGSAKRGVGRLVLDADSTPIVVPFVHTGMQEIMPLGANFPRVGKIVTVLVGDPIKFDDLLNAEGTEGAMRGNLYDAVSSRIGHRLHELKIQVDKLALEQSRRMKEIALKSMDQATEILEQVDWESFGMSSYIVSRGNTTLYKQERQAEKEEVLSNPEMSISNRWYNKTTGFAHDGGGILSRIKSFVDSTELTGFAARAVLLNNSERDRQQFSPLRAWKQFLEANCGMKVQLC